MRKQYGIAGAAASLTLLLGLTGCQQGQAVMQHKLIVTGNQHSVPLYSDEQTFTKVSRMKQQGGVEGMAGDVSKGLEAKAIDDQTPVNVVSSDDNGAVVEITSGPLKGQTGFVATQNLD
jgi:transcription antitermination factor NusG